MNHLDQRSLKMIENRNSATTKTVGGVPEDRKKQQVGGKKQSRRERRPQTCTRTSPKISK